MLSATFAAFTIGAASAHSVWIESHEGKLVVRFGEVGGKFETSPGYLDSLESPAAMIAPATADQKAEKVTTEKAADFILLKEVATDKATVLSTNFPVMGKAEKARWPQFYARWQAPATPGVPVSTLDIVPTAEAGKATVFYKGKPLPKAELTLLQPDGKEKDLTANDEGVVTYTAEGKGLFVLSVAGYSETSSGEHAGKAYTVISHNSSLSWVQ